MSSPTVEGALASAVEADRARRRAGVARWRRHSRLIRFFRVALPALILVVALSLGGWILYNTLFWRLTGTQDAEGLSIRMINPKFFGRSEHDSPFMITAKSAVRDERDFQRVVLEKPVFIADRGALTESQLSAEHGVYREDTHILTLEKNIVLVDKRGYTFNTQHAVVDTVNNTIVGNSPASGFGPIGRIAASSYGVDQGGERLVFRGGVKARIEQSSAKGR